MLLLHLKEESSGKLNVGGTTNITGNVAIGKTTAAAANLEVVGVIVATNNGGSSDVQLYVNPNPDGSYSIVQAFKQSVGGRDLRVLMKNLVIGAGASPSFGGGSVEYLSPILGPFRHQIQEEVYYTSQVP